VSAQISAPIRIVGLLGVLAAAAIGAYTFTQGPAGSSGGGPNSAAAIEQQAKSVASRLSGHNVATAQGKLGTTTTPAPAAAKPAAKPAPAATTPAVKPAATKPAPAKPAAAKPAPAKHADNAKTTIAVLLHTYNSVVVVLYDPQSKVDAYSVSEAELGAREAGAGFLRVNVLDQHAAAPFTKAYGVLQDPSVLFFGRPGKLMQKLTGFADHDTVAQAATNVALGLVGTSS
jgi:hypothetical protein